MINVFFHNITTLPFNVTGTTTDKGDGVVLNQDASSLDKDTALYTIYTELGTNDLARVWQYLSYMAAFPWIEEKLNPENWANKTYVTSNLPLVSLDKYESLQSPEEILQSLNSEYSRDIKELLSNVGYFSDYVSADTSEEKLCWILLAVAMQTKFYTHD